MQDEVRRIPDVAAGAACADMIASLIKIVLVVDAMLKGPSIC